MSKLMATGSKFAIGATFGSVLTMNSLSNAAEAVAGLTDASSLTAGDIVIVTSGWGQLNGRIVRVKTVASNNVTLEALDTTDTVKYPTGTGTGSLKEVLTFVDISQISGIAPSGGDQQYADASDLDDVDDKQIPSSRTAQSLAITVHDDPTLTWYATVRAASDSVAQTPLRITFPGGSKLFAPSFWSLRETPDITRNETLKARLALTFAAKPMRYST